MAHFEKAKTSLFSKGKNAMKIIKLTALSLLLCIIFTTFTGCASLRTMYYGAELYGYLNKSVRSEFAENNIVDYYTSKPKEEDIPSSRTFIINDNETFNEVFETAPFEVDFQKETVYVCTFITYRRTYVLDDISIEDGCVNIYLSSGNFSISGFSKNDDDKVYGYAPYQHWTAVKMKKQGDYNVKFFIRSEGYDRYSKFYRRDKEI